MQLLLECIQGLYPRSGAASYVEFIRRGDRLGAWSGQKLVRLEELDRELRLVRTEDNIGHRARRCEQQIRGLYGNFDAMIRGLRSLLGSDRVQDFETRRVMTNAYLERRNRNWGELASNAEELQAVYNLLSDNLAEDRANPRDLWMWFQAYRRLPTFNIGDAIDRFTLWSGRNGPAAQAYYYLYILHYIRYLHGIHEDADLVRRYIERCRMAAQTERVRSFEWRADSPEWCPLVHESELGRWDREAQFWRETSRLSRVRGSIKSIGSPQTGSLAVGPFTAFFAPRRDFWPGRDENAEVDFYLGFSYDGFRAWRVRRVQV